MRAPRRRRPLHRQLASWRHETARLEALAERVSYVGSPEHKRMPSYAGAPRPRADASLCPTPLNRDRSIPERWLQEAIRKGAVGEMLEGEFPRYVWYRHADATTGEVVVYEGRLVNRASGEYKGYPLEAGEVPTGLEALFD